MSRSKPRGGRRETRSGKVLQERRAPRDRGRTGDGVIRTRLARPRARERALQRVDPRARVADVHETEDRSTQKKVHRSVERGRDQMLKPSGGC